MMLFFGFLVVVVFIWMAKNGHFDDMDGQANRIFMDDEFPEDIEQKKQASSVEEARDDKLSAGSKESEKTS